ncbi:MAG: hypothetical protein IIA89_07720 [Chloroflexi bacterium]|nr:hypothetical protein [Chloroflexota bacterium]
MRLDKNMRLLMAEVDRLPGLRTLYACGGHFSPGPDLRHLVAEGCFQLHISVNPSRGGDLGLDALGTRTLLYSLDVDCHYLITTVATVPDGRRIVDLVGGLEWNGEERSWYRAKGSAGRKGIIPDSLAEWLNSAHPDRPRQKQLSFDAIADIHWMFQEHAKQKRRTNRMLKRVKFKNSIESMLTTRGPD